MVYFSNGPCTVQDTQGERAARQADAPQSGIGNGEADGFVLGPDLRARCDGNGSSDEREGESIRPRRVEVRDEGIGIEQGSAVANLQTSPSSLRQRVSGTSPTSQGCPRRG